MIDSFSFILATGLAGFASLIVGVQILWDLFVRIVR